MRATKLVALALVCTAWAGMGCGSSNDSQNSGAFGPVDGEAGTGGAGSAGTTGSGGSGSVGGAGGSGTGGGGTAGTGTGGTAGDSGSGTAGAAGSGTAGTGGKAGAGGAAGSGTAGTGGSGTSGTKASGTIVPLYTYPTDPTWSTIATAALAHPGVTVEAVINPDNGPGASRDQAYATGITKLNDAGIVVIAYVATTYGAKSAAKLQSEIDQYRAWYPGISGIFFDEMSNTPGDESYYAGLTNYVKGLGYKVTIGNPGSETAPSYVGTVDTILIYESAGTPSTTSVGGWHQQYDRSNFGVIPYGVKALNASFVAEVRPLVGFIYLTNDLLPNPWDSLPPYFDALLAALE